MKGSTLLPLAALLVAALFCCTPAAAAEVRWGGEEFVGPAALREWLTARGLSYRSWARNHPSAAARLAGSNAHSSAQTEGLSVTHTAVEQGLRSASPRGAEPEGGSKRLPGLLGGVAVCLLLLALLPSVRRYRVGFPAALERRRLELAASGVAIGVAIGAAYFL